MSIETVDTTTLGGMFADEDELVELNKYKVNLSVEQQSAVDASTPTVVLAAAGTGKTTTMIKRVEKAHNEDGIALDNIFLSTFSKMAANDMATRLIKDFGSAPKYTGTFHRNSLYMYREFPFLLTCHDYSQKRLRMVSPASADSILRDLLSEFQDQLDEKGINIGDMVSAFMRAINALKGKGFYPIDYHMNKAILLVKSLNHDSTLENFTGIFDEKTERIIETEIISITNLHFFWNIFTQYQNTLKLANQVDFNDVIALLTFALRDESIRKRVVPSFKLVIVDEFQDCSRMQLELVSYLSDSHKNSYLVGDEDQLLYAWRDADINQILSFYQRDDFNVRVLEGNYRSTKPIIDLAAKIITRNTARYTDKLMKPMRNDFIAQNPNAVHIIQPYDDLHEAQAIAAHIKSYLQKGIKAEEIAIIYGYHDYRKYFEQVFNEQKIDYHLVKGFNFLEYKEVQKVLSYLLLAIDHTNDGAFEEVVNFPSRGNGAVFINNLKKSVTAGKKECLYDALLANMEDANKNTKQYKSNEEFIEIVQELEKMIKAASYPVEAIMGYIDQKLNLEDYLRTEHGSNEGDHRYSRFIQLEDRISKYKEEFGGFIEAVNEIQNQMFDIEKEEMEDKIQLMTVFASKGLEFKVVFIVGAVNGIFPSYKPNSNIEETRRVFYVAVTRAKDELFISSPRYNERVGTVVENMITEHLEDLEEFYTMISADKLKGYNARVNSVGASYIGKRKVTKADAPKGFYESGIKEE